MAQYINTNMSSLNAQRNLNTSQGSLTSALQRLSSGLRINSAKDDAAGLGIADRFSTQIRGLNQAVRNANDGISLSQTAEGALGTVIDNLQRMRELAVQSANATNTSIDRNALQSEVGQLVSEIDRVSKTTNFNGIALLDGTFSAQSFQVGANSGQTISVSMASAAISKLGSGQSAALSATNNGTALATGDLVLNGVVVQASVASSDTASSANKEIGAIAKAAAVNAVKDQTGVTAVVNANERAGNSMTVAAASTANTVTINGVATSAFTLNSDSNALSRQTVVQAINAIKGQTGVEAIDTGDDKSGVKLVAADGRNIAATAGSSTFTAATTGISGLTTQASYTYGSYTLVSNQTINIGSQDGKSLQNAGVTAGTYATQTAYVTSNEGLATLQSTAASQNIQNGDVKINGVLVGAQKASDDVASSTFASVSAIGKAAAVNAVSANTGVTAVVNQNVVTGAAMSVSTTTTAGKGITVNGVSTAAISLSTENSLAQNREAVVQAINAIKTQTGVTAVDTGGSANGIKLVAADGRNISVAGGDSTFTAAATGIQGLTSTSSTATFVGTISLQSAKQFTVEMGNSGNGTASLGIDVGTYGDGKTGAAIKDLNVSTVAGANAALTAIDNALASVNAARGDLGAVQNRFSATVTNLQTTSENLTASRSRIQDADFAQETANLTRAQILQQAGVAMLAQANSLPNQVLTLLRG